MRELTEINTVLNNSVYWTHEVTSGLAAWAHSVVIVLRVILFELLLSEIRWGLRSVSLSSTVGQFVVDSSWDSCPVVFSESILRKYLVLIIFANNVGTHDLDLTVSAEELVTIFALLWLVWELFTNGTNDFLYHLPLEFVLDLIHFDVELGDGVGAHQLLEFGLTSSKLISLSIRKPFLLCVDLL